MGKKVLQYFRESVTKSCKFAFVSTFILSLLIHLYKFTNVLPNHDSLLNYYSDQNVLGSGRWALSIACGFSSFYDLPWLTGLFSCFFIALTVTLIVALFKLENPILIGICGALTAAAPGTTETFFYQYTADGYMIAMFLATLAVFLTQIGEKRWYRYVLGGICVCVSCGIYQAYVSFYLILLVCLCIYSLLMNSHPGKIVWGWVLRQMFTFIGALLSYYVLWQLIMHLTGTVANDFQGISEVGTVSVDLLVNGAVKSVRDIIMFIMQWNVLEHGVSLYTALNIIFLLFMIIGIVIACIKSKIVRRKSEFLLLGLCILAIIPFACMWNFVSKEVQYQAMLLQSLILLFILTAIIYEKFAGNILKNTLCILLIVIAFNNAIMANISYFYMNRCYERSYYEGVAMMIDINEMQEDYQIEKIAIVGNKYKEVLNSTIDSDGNKLPTGELKILIGGIQKTFIYNHIRSVPYLQNTFGLELEAVTETELEHYCTMEEVQGLPCWPADGSMIVVDDTLVVKLSDTLE